MFIFQVRSCSIRVAFPETTGCTNIMKDETVPEGWKGRNPVRDPISMNELWNYGSPFP